MNLMILSILAWGSKMFMIFVITKMQFQDFHYCFDSRLQFYDFHDFHDSNIESYVFHDFRDYREEL